MPNLYIISGCNGAGKTTASLTILPEMLNCREFVNADSIAAGLSPLDVEKYSFEAGRIMIKRIDQLMTDKADFAIETTLSSKAYLEKIKQAKKLGYKVYLFFFWLNRVELALRRVRSRVKSGGHSIPVDVIRRRHKRGLVNFFDLYREEVDYWVVLDNSQKEPINLAEGEGVRITKINAENLWRKVTEQYKKNID